MQVDSSKPQAAKKMSSFTAIPVIIASTLGTGITSMPLVVKSIGITYTIIFMAVIGLVTFHSIYALSYTSVMVQKEDVSYTSLAGYFSKALEKIVVVFMTFACLSTTFIFIQRLLSIIIYLVKQNDFMKFLLEDNPSANFSLRVGILFLLCMAYFFLFRLEDLASLTFFSHLSLASAVIFSLAMGFYGIKSPSADIGTSGERNFSLAFGSSIFALHCQSTFTGILSSIEDKSLPNLRFVTFFASMLAALLYGAVGCFGYWGLGDSMGLDSVLKLFIKDASPVLESLELRFGYLGGVLLPKIICSLFSLIFFSGIVFNMFPVIPIVQNMFSKTSDPLNAAAKPRKISRKAVSLIGCLFVFLSGFYQIGAIDQILAVVGSVVITPLSFIFPSLFIILSTKKFNLMKFIAITVAFVSSCAMVVLFYLEVMSLVESMNKSS